MWSDPGAARAFASRDLPTILRAYRAINGLSQQDLAQLLDYDKSYIAMIETGKRSFDGVRARQHLAHRLGLPYHLLGVTDPDDADFAALVQFGDSVIRLADIARQAGRAVDAVNELWPLVARLEARAAEGRLDPHTLRLLAHGRLSLGVSLGTVLPEERLTGAAVWTGKALLIARHLDDPAFLGHALRMHGNELRKADRLPAAIARLEHAAAIATTPDDRGTAVALLARAAGEARHEHRFTEAISECHRVLDQVPYQDGMLLNPFSLREIHARGLVCLNRPVDALNVLSRPAATAPAAPQWQVIEHVTHGETLAAMGDHNGSAETLTVAIHAAENRRLPHQLQRVVRAADNHSLHAVAEDGRSALSRLRSMLALTT
ncbi:helix-turn-helix domain-containing protein [Amycolatopsis roodepoortensis]|uniref:helix-turn-helix domain-containing protein n=1 Tax=Amycolatopsis roodepoortensis TaxID=700274 RepID=UPI00214C2A7A|nr:helix-turn-helix transcriptional regulator [Amycolatopsis roodepoortensis]UUV32300.1 helix-turn-helix domain-containing protein [Amycolatopsis roodepoortensis]